MMMVTQIHEQMKSFGENENGNEDEIHFNMKNIFQHESNWKLGEVRELADLLWELLRSSFRLFRWKCGSHVKIYSTWKLLN